MTKKEILTKVEKLSPEQKDFVIGEIKKHSRRADDSSEDKEKSKKNQQKKNKI